MAGREGERSKSTHRTERWDRVGVEGEASPLSGGGGRGSALRPLPGAHARSRTYVSEKP